MKIALTTSSDGIDGEVDPRFGRANYFLIHDTESEETTLVDNTQNLNLPGGAGIQAAEAVSRHEIEYLLTGHCGPKAFATLNAAGVKVIVGVEGKIKDAIERMKKGEFEIANSPDVQGHW